MQGARANYLRKVKKMQKIYELSIGVFIIYSYMVDSAG